MTDQNVQLPPFGPFHNDCPTAFQMLQQREVQLRRAIHENAALWDELAAAKHDDQHTRSLIAEILYLQERIEKLEARIVMMVESLEKTEKHMWMPGYDEELRRQVQAALATARRLHPDKESAK